MSIFQDGGRGRWILLPISYLLTPLPTERQNLSADQISSTYLNWRLRYNYFRFWKQTSAILEFYFRFRSRPFCRNLHVILHQITEIRPNRRTRYGIMTSWRPRPLNTAFCFVFGWCHCLQKVKVCQQTKFHRHISIHGWDITTSGKCKKNCSLYTS